MTCCCEITDLPICLEKKEFIDFRFTTTNKIKVIYSLSWRRHLLDLFRPVCAATLLTFHLHGSFDLCSTIWSGCSTV